MMPSNVPGEDHQALKLRRLGIDTYSDPVMYMRAIRLAGAVLELASAAGTGLGAAMAASALDDGRAWRKFQAEGDSQCNTH